MQQNVKDNELNTKSIEPFKGDVGLDTLCDNEEQYWQPGQSKHCNALHDKGDWVGRDERKVTDKGCKDCDIHETGEDYDQREDIEDVEESAHIKAVDNHGCILRLIGSIIEHRL
jgi:hypothetical protein